MASLISYWPSGLLLTWLLVVLALDFVFGVLKAILQGARRTSRGFRRSVVKLLQYGGCIVIAIVILNIVYGSNLNFGRQFAWLFGDLMLYLMIYIEIVSILENLEAISPTALFVRIFVRPVRRLITFRLKNLFDEDPVKL